MSNEVITIRVDELATYQRAVELGKQRVAELQAEIKQLQEALKERDAIINVLKRGDRT